MRDRENAGVETIMAMGLLLVLPPILSPVSVARLFVQRRHTVTTVRAYVLL